MSTEPITQQRQFTFDHYRVKIPAEIWLQIAQYLRVQELNELARSDSAMFDFIFCRNLKNENGLVQGLKNWFNLGLTTEKAQELDDYTLIQRFIWKRLLIHYFPRFNPEINVKNYLAVLQRRIKHLRKFPKNNFLHVDDDFIENCEWVYKCPINFTLIGENYQETALCKVCNETVFRVRHLESFKYHSDAGHCVAFTYKGKVSRGCILY